MAADAASQQPSGHARDQDDFADDGEPDAYSHSEEHGQVEPDPSHADLPVYEVTSGRKVRLILQGAFALVGIGLFIWLAFLLADGEGATGLTIGLVVTLGIILVLEIILLEPVLGLFVREVHGIEAGEEDQYVVGCPGCGTVFTVTEEEIEVGTFSCHNCGRPGVVKSQDLSRTDIQRETCRNCGNTYYEYLEHSECPVCHTYNEY